jgi:hypothetical protein
VSNIRGIWHGAPPPFPPTDQHPDARRFGPIALGDGSIVFVDALGDQPDVAAIEAVLKLPQVPPASARLDRHLAAAISEFSASQPANPGKPTMTSPAAAGLNVRQLMEDHTRMMGEIHTAQIELLKSSLARQRATLSTGVTTVAEKIDGQTDEFLSIMGQFANDLGID